MSKESIRNTLVLKLLFGGFSYPQESRFVNIFLSQRAIPLQASNANKQKKKSLNIETINVENGKDKRTTIIIKNLPNDISKDEVKSIIEPLGNINFIYIPLLIKNKNKLKNNLPCAYVNVINYKTILKILQRFEQLKALNPIYKCKDFSKIEIFYSGTQGKHALINRFSLEKKYLPPNQSISFS
jgi:protein phosphatase 1 regulatory subunit 42